jgi:hypothetical protein
LSSDGATWYTVTLGDEPACECPGFVYRGACCHVAAAILRLGQFEVCYSCSQILQPDEGVYRANGYRYCGNVGQCMRNRATGRELLGMA